jgi:hypothetical protein
MKLLGTRTEEEFREQLLKSSDSLLNGEYAKVGALLMAQFPELRTVFALGHTPEQDEDLFLLLINTDTLVSVDVDRRTGTASFRRHLDLDEYVKRLSQMKRILFAVAVDLARKKP